MKEQECFNPVLRGDSGALKRALYKSMGFTGRDLTRPIIAVANSYTNANPGHFNLNHLSEQVKRGIEAAGGTAMVFGCTAPCDGIAEGHEGMRYILPSRDLIASSIECMVRAHRFDGLVLLGSCDKIEPGMLMAAARLDIPSVFVNGGPMYPAEYKGKHYDGNIITEAEGWKRRGIIGEAEFTRIENLAEPCCGSCAMLGTANTMACLAEAMGMALPGTAMIPAVRAARFQAAYHAGEAVMALVRGGIGSRKIMTQEAMENAIRVLLGIGGSTNGILHLQAIWHDAGLGELPLKVFDDLSRKTPQVASIYPASPFDVVDFYEAGGVPAVMKELEPLLHTGALTVTGKSVADNIGSFTYSSRRELVKTMEAPFSPEGGVAVLSGNLAPAGAVVKPAAVPSNMMCFSGKARIFHSENEAIDAIMAGKVQAGTAVVLRYEGPKGGPGMPEMYRPMKCLEGMNLSESCALITDGRFSGSNRGCFVGHISPEAWEGGPLALAEDGDIISINIPGRTLEIKVGESELAKRKERWRCPEKKYSPRVSQNLSKISKSAASGAVIE
jgi:dihydroxy-acid dehydratase